jgi:hypothetical protein
MSLKREVIFVAAGQSSNTKLVPGAYQALERFKKEVASELGIPNYEGYLGDLPSRINGAVGGHMVRRMIAAAEQSLIQQSGAIASSQIQSAIQGYNAQSQTSNQTAGTSQYNQIKMS